jgi:hypothetical protein
MWCVDSFKTDLKEAGIENEVLLGMDGLPAQKTPEFLRKTVESNILPIYTPPDCTDVVAPCDHHVFLRLKELIKAFYKEMSQVNRDLWARDSAALSDSRKRVLVAQWVSRAWSDFCQNYQDVISAAFTSTGFLMKLANPGADIKIKGLPSYPGTGLDPF